MSATKRQWEEVQAERCRKQEQLLEVPRLMATNEQLTQKLGEQLEEANETIRFLRDDRQRETERFWKVKVLDWVAAGIVGSFIGYGVSMLLS